MLAAELTDGMRRHIQINAKTPFFITSSLFVLMCEKKLLLLRLPKAINMPDCSFATLKEKRCCFAGG
jgi:hypothetical protein